MAKFLQLLVNGLVLGSIYGLIAIGYTMVYGIVGMINFAHGEIYMLGAFLSLIAFVALSSLGVASVPLTLVTVLLVAVVLTSFWGWTVERIAYRPLRRAPRLAPLISAIGVSIFLQNFVQLTQGARSKAIQPVLRGGVTLYGGPDGSSGNFAVTLSWLQIAIVAFTTVLMIAFTLLIARTPLGRAQRACSQDLKMASLLGIDVDRTISTTFVIGAALAAVAGMLVTLYYGVIDFFIGFLAGIKAFTAAVLGGIGSLPGAMLGGLLIGLVEAFWAGYAAAEYKDVAVYAILVLVLTVRPSGLLGRPAIEKV